LSEVSIEEILEKRLISRLQQGNLSELDINNQHISGAIEPDMTEEDYGE
jgi:hypothetical protein